VRQLLWDEATGQGRWEIWSRALWFIRDAPLSGIGLNAFRELAGVRYPFETPIPAVHAHNIFLQTALDLGIIGLAAYVALLIVVGWQARRAYRDGDPRHRRLVLGLAGGLVAVHVFGITDAIALGAKVGLFFWWNVALIGALYSHSLKTSIAHHPSPRADARPAQGALV
jgi:putative inorganic carbon (HCO3(-)) transporter